jgi:hypothetical protein
MAFCLLQQSESQRARYWEDLDADALQPVNELMSKLKPDFLLPSLEL